MAVFELAIPFILKNEGGFVNDPNDHGGATNFGISLKYLLSNGGITKYAYLDSNKDGVLDVVDMKALTKDLASEIYKSDWWEANKYGSITNQAIANKVLDMSVNMGSSRAHKIVQSSLCSCGKTLKIDGVLGQQSFNAINQSDPVGLMHVICAQQADFYRSIVHNNPTQAKFLNGWIKRSQWTGS